MASRWVVSQRGAETLAFGELVALARCGELSEDDLVKAEWDLEWRPAHTVVGLFYRVRRTEPVAENSVACEAASLLDTTDAGFSFDDLSADLPLDAADEAEPIPVADPRWMQRYREVTEQRARESMSQAPTDESLTNQEPSQVRFLADAALQAIEKRSTFGERLSRGWTVANRLVEITRSPVFFRTISALFVAAIVSYSVASWSRQAALRFPKPGMPDRYVVPLLGDCNSREFAFVLCSLAFWSAVAGYWGAKRVENLAESR